MAANLAVRTLASFGKRFIGQIRSRDSVVGPSLSLRRRDVHGSVYDKNLEEHVHPTVVPDEVIPAAQPEQYWAPHPQTGVFGPATLSDQKSAIPTSSSGGLGVSGGGGGGDQYSVLEQQAFFRPQEDLDKPAVQP